MASRRARRRQPRTRPEPGAVRAVLDGNAVLAGRCDAPVVVARLWEAATVADATPARGYPSRRGGVPRRAASARRVRGPGGGFARARVAGHQESATAPAAPAGSPHQTAAGFDAGASSRASQRTESAGAERRGRGARASIRAGSGRHGPGAHRGQSRLPTGRPPPRGP
ncbi:MAG: hypothetical protein OXC08_18670, partial [Thiotrichales bacterium]|nr:hypothetical protein [Thiotrichales bacterium]